MKSVRADGSAGSMGRYAAPTLSTDTIAVTASMERGSSSATVLPLPTPRLANRCANRFEASSSSRYVRDRPSHVMATACGASATLAANIAGTETGTASACVAAAQFPSSS
jgi:hypothetical protein